MAQNMQKRKDELFINIQQGGQLSFFDLGSACTSSVEGEVYSRSEIEAKVIDHLNKSPAHVQITKFLASFVNEYGLICEFKMIYEILEELQTQKAITIERIPERTQTGKPTAFWEESKDHSVTIRRQ